MLLFGGTDIIYDSIHIRLYRRLIDMKLIFLHYFFDQVGSEHAGFKILTENMERIKFKGKAIHLKDDYNPSCLLPSKVNLGRLTSS